MKRHMLLLLFGRRRQEKKGMLRWGRGVSAGVKKRINKIESSSASPLESRSKSFRPSPREEGKSGKGEAKKEKKKIVALHASQTKTSRVKRAANTGLSKTTVKIDRENRFPRDPRRESPPKSEREKVEAR